ncbi:hypothetical protein EL78_3290 [Escherichia coli]|nr:hypothetical protein EL78_3290 [Escherichia coli]
MSPSTLLAHKPTISLSGFFCGKACGLRPDRPAVLTCSLDFQLIGVSISALFCGLFDQLRRQCVVFYRLGSVCHTIQHSQPVRFVSDRDIGYFTLEPGASVVKELDPLFAKIFSHRIFRVVGRYLLPGNNDTKILFYKFDNS